MLVNERKKMTKSEFYSDLFLDSHVLSGTFASVFFFLTARQCHSVCMLGLGGSSFFGRFLAGASVWYFEISLAIPK